ncbi:hypothetical protein [Stenotrophomonas sp. NPDC077659]|uniref:hypothetical protein n=1 Tax=Stenotrophomonas sp. NPDC077659 TaxID=3390694 RepID=UPI003D01B7F9
MKTSILTALAALSILHVAPLHVRAEGADPSIPKASEPASREDQKALWKKVEQLAFATVAGTDSVKRAAAMDRGRLPDGGAYDLAIGDRLTGTNVALQLDPVGKLEALSFDLRGGCVSTRTLLSQYPDLLVLQVPYDPRANSLVGTTIGGALVTFRMAPGPGPCALGVTVQTVEMAKAHLLLR